MTSACGGLGASRVISPLPLQELPTLPNLKLAVVGHVEWMTFLSVDEMPRAGIISHSRNCFSYPAGGGAVIAVELSRLLKQPVHFFTALGRDELGIKSLELLKKMGLIVSVAWSDKPTRKGISFVDSKGERAITVIGERLKPTSHDELPWTQLRKYHGVFVTATDFDALRYCREANILAATPRVGLDIFEKANVQLDLLVGSSLDPGEQLPANLFKPTPKIIIGTEGAKGGFVSSIGSYKAVEINSPIVDSYGCGDSFAAGMTAGLSAGWNIEMSISLGAHCGARCAKILGPYDTDLYSI